MRYLIVAALMIAPVVTKAQALPTMETCIALSDGVKVSMDSHTLNIVKDSMMGCVKTATLEFEAGHLARAEAQVAARRFITTLLLVEEELGNRERRKQTT